MRSRISARADSRAPRSSCRDPRGTVGRAAGLAMLEAMTAPDPTPIELRDPFTNLTATVHPHAGMLISSIPAAYALAKLQWRGRNLAFLLVIGAMMLPPQVVAVPLYDTWSSLGLTGTLWPLIVPYFLFDAFSIFLLRQFMLTIPQSYVDAARVDGCSEFQALVRIIVPMAKPGIAATALFCFLFTWNDYFGPLLYTGEVKDQWTLSLALALKLMLPLLPFSLAVAVGAVVSPPPEPSVTHTGADHSRRPLAWVILA